MSLFGIMPFSGLGSLQVGLNMMNDFLSLHDKIKAKVHPFTRFNPV
jgi:hypothetical protein